MLVVSVLFDKEISATAKCIFATLAVSLRKGSRVASMGQRLIARKLGFDRGTVSKGLKELAQRGHVTVSQVGRKRPHYFMVSTRFEVEEAARGNTFVAGGAVPREHLQVPCGEAPIFRADKKTA